MRSTLNLKFVEIRMKAGIALYAHTASKKLETKAKKDRKWTDRTSNARNSLKGSFGWIGKDVVVVLSGNMRYSPMLELAREKKYAVITPTTQAMTQEVLNGFAKVVGK